MLLSCDEGSACFRITMGESIMTSRMRFAVSVPLLLLLLPAIQASGDSTSLLEKIGAERGIVAVLVVPTEDIDAVIDLAKQSELRVYCQSSDIKQVTALRRAAEQANLLGQRVFVQLGSSASIHLASNVADCVVASPDLKHPPSDTELLRVLRPQATAHIGARKLVKPIPEGIDEWTHPYHGPDNNPQSSDKLVHGDLQTQFLADPKFSPMPEQTVVAGGRIYKAMGHIAHKANQNAMLNKLLCINAYNGTILWSRELPEGFMIHRNTMIATRDALYMGDHESCKVFNGRTGELRRQITVPREITDGPVWKWMALRGDTLYALVGNPEVSIETVRSNRGGLGHWPWGMWKGHDYKDPRTSFGFGRTLVAIDLKTNKLLWHYRDDEFLDARGVCMNDQNIFCYSPGKFLMAVSTDDGALAWNNRDEDLLEAIGENQRAQLYVTGYSTSCYMKCNNDLVFFAGPQRKRLVAASAADGKLAWTHPHGNLQLVLRDDAIYAAGPMSSGARLDYATGAILGELPTRRACTRATGCADSIFYRTSGGTVRLITESNTAQHIAPMRPPCQDGVVISNGQLYWGPWMCGCQLSLYGHISLAPKGSPSDPPSTDDEPALRVGEEIETVARFEQSPNDWSTYRGDNAQTNVTNVAIPRKVRLAWKADVSAGDLPTAPVVAGGLVFIADRNGIVRALDKEGHLVWKAYTGGPIYFAPTVANDRVYVGSADGRVYALAARTGRFLWSYRVAPHDRWIPVYGRLISTWPVAGGVVVEGSTVYAAAGIAHYDGTYVVALDAVTGEVKARNDTSGVLSDEVNSGISLQGALTIEDGELRFLAGGVYETARYDLKTLKCLNSPRVQVTSQYRTAFYPYYPNYGKYVSLDHRLADGGTLSCDSSYEGSSFSNLALCEPLPEGAPRPRKEAARWPLRPRGQQGKIIWLDRSDVRPTSFVVSDDQLLVTGHAEGKTDETFLVAINIKDGARLWGHGTPAETVKGGTAIDSQGRIFATLVNGQLLCYEPTEP